MKVYFTVLFIFLMSNTYSQISNPVVCKADTTDATNDFYDNSDNYALKLGNVVVSGEVLHAGKVDFSKLHKQHLIVKDAKLIDGETKFIGAYSYRGYSLFDIINQFTLNKKTQKDFNQVTDVFVEVENDKGEKVVFSWGEIYYAAHLHQIMIAVEMSPIIPSKLKVEWPINQKAKIIAANDFFTERNIENPVKITVKSVAEPFNFQPRGECKTNIIHLLNNRALLGNIEIDKIQAKKHSTNSIFYGRGRGLHSTTDFEGYLFKDVLNQFPFSIDNVQHAYFVIDAQDGYRVVYSYSEIYNRNDQSELFLVKGHQEEEVGIRLYPSFDFFSDRAIYCIKEIDINKIK